MKKLKFDYMNEAQIATMDNLLRGEHAEAVKASMYECFSYGYKTAVKRAFIAIGVAAAADLAIHVIRRAIEYHEFKKNLETNSKEKPGRTWEA